MTIKELGASGRCGKATKAHIPWQKRTAAERIKQLWRSARPRYALQRRSGAAALRNARIIGILRSARGAQCGTANRAVSRWNICAIKEEKLCGVQPATGRAWKETRGSRTIKPPARGKKNVTGVKHKPRCRGLCVRHIASAMALPISVVPDFPPTSRVRGPSTRIASTASTMAFAASGCPRCSSIMAPDHIWPTGFAIPLP